MSNQMIKTPEHWFALSGKALLTVLLPALLIRFFCSAMGWTVTVDSSAYFNSALALANGEWRHFYVERTPAYPLLILMGMSVSQFGFGSANPAMLQKVLLLVQTMMGCGTAVLAADLCYRLLRASRPALVSDASGAQQVEGAFTGEASCRLTPKTAEWTAISVGLIAALSPNLIGYEHAMLTETMFAFAVTLFVWMMARLWQTPLHSPRWTYLLAGLMTGALMWIKPIAFSVGFATLYFLFWCGQRLTPPLSPLPQGEKERLQSWLRTLLKLRSVMGLTLAGWALVVAPWIFFNWTVHYTPTFAASSGANQLYKTIDWVDWQSPLHPEYKAMLYQRYTAHAKPYTYNAVNDVHVMMYEAQKDMRTYSEIYLEHDNQARDIALESFWKHPVQYAIVTLREWVKFVIAPNTTAWGQWLWWMLLFFALPGAWLFCQAWRSKPALLLVLLIPAAHWIAYPLMTVTEARYRVPFEPLIAIPAVYAMVILWQEIRSSQPVSAVQDH